MSKPEPRQLRLNLIKGLKRLYIGLLVFCVVVDGGFVLLLYVNERLFFFPLAAMLILTAFTVGGFFPIIKFTVFEKKIQALKDI